jgi:hypothetical protein
MGYQYRESRTGALYWGIAGKMKPYFKSKFGQIIRGDSLEYMASLEAESIDLIVTSPPFGLVRKKAYGNVESNEYVDWFKQYGASSSASSNQQVRWSSTLAEHGYPGSWRGGPRMKCCCEDAGTLRSGVMGILACPLNRTKLTYVIERCDACERFDSDEAAAIQYATARGGTVRYSRCDDRLRVLWSPWHERKRRI